MSTLIQRLYFPSVSSSSKGLSLGTPRRPFNHSGLAAQYLLFWLISVSLTQTGSVGYWLLWASSKGLLVACWMQEKPVRHKKTLISKPWRPKTLKFGEQLGEEPSKNASDGSSVGFLVVLWSCSVFSSPSSVESACGLTAATQERNSVVLHDVIKINPAC